VRIHQRGREYHRLGRAHATVFGSDELRMASAHG